MKVGMIKTACDLYEKLEMYEELVTGLSMAGEREKAKQTAQKHLDLYPKSPKMLCIMGDLTGDFQYYKKAWKISGKKFARAQRELGRVYFYKGQFQKSIKAFKKATQINCLTVDPFFTMGCAYMKLEDYPGAISSFSSCVSIDNTAADAWANMANAFLAQGKKQQAFTTLEQAVKHNEKSWRMWHNLLQISLQNKKFYKYFECIQRLVQLDKGLETIDDFVLVNLNKIFAYNVSMYPKTPYKSPFNTLRLRIERLYVFMCEKIGQNYLVWSNFADFCELQQEFLRQEMYYTILQNQKEIEKAKSEEDETQGKKIKFADSTKPAFKTEEQIKEEYNIKIANLKTKVFDLRQSAVNVCMVSGWESSKQICEKLLPLAEEYLLANKEANRGEEGQIEMQRFVKSITPPLERNLEKKITFQI
ncbi:hypothetical protein PPERSA_10290 [Pseudocohnilembus persalinus]|uniref:Uncharacterized protein n=1 Tax=Pseudocohnilembus persalinus TaxID=266149 RepID=A0A0V0R067_PSEPJ|nr:hypothetical protein PPERSA_10290 [Pseudocohnilembus persalinus]|eukprot:KRX07902.1 hypothetical protein PPERSA_10290 [Pseudocohnilembus persalinus]